MHSIEEILREIRKDSNLCQAIEKKGLTCYKKKSANSLYCGKHASRLRRLKSFDLPIKEKRKCKFIDCKNKYIAKGFCNKHYRKHKLLTEQKKCIVDICMNKALRKGYCNKHAMRMARHGDINANFSANRFSSITRKGKTPWNKGKFNTVTCICPGCEIKNGEPYRFVKGLCKKHFARWKKHGDYNLVLPSRRNKKSM